MILQQIEHHGIKIETIIACGGLAHNNPLLMQIYADITRRSILVSSSSQTCALGAAIAASVVAKLHPNVGAAQKQMCGTMITQFLPDERAARTYDALFELYRPLHDGFGDQGGAPVSLHHIMKQLHQIKWHP